MNIFTGVAVAMIAYDMLLHAMRIVRPLEWWAETFPVRWWPSFRAATWRASWVRYDTFWLIYWTIAVVLVVVGGLR